MSENSKIMAQVAREFRLNEPDTEQSSSVIGDYNRSFSTTAKPDNTRVRPPIIGAAAETDGFLAKKVKGRLNDPNWLQHTAEDGIAPFADNMRDAYPNDNAKIMGGVAIDMTGIYAPLRFAPGPWKIPALGLSWLLRQGTSSKIKESELKRKAEEDRRKQAQPNR